MYTGDPAKDPFWTDEEDGLLTNHGKDGISVYGTTEDYYEWLNRGRTLCESHSDNQWNIGDWLIEGECAFDFKSVVGDLPRHMLIGRGHAGDDGEIEYKSIKVPNFWKDAAAETGSAVNTLKVIVRVARAYPKDVRFRQLSFTHHQIAAAYGRRLEYLQACLDGLEPGHRPRPIAWLYAYMEEKEGNRHVLDIRELASHIIQFNVDDETHRKLKQAARYYRMSIQELVQARCVSTINALIPELSQKISLEKYGWWEEGKWPFYEPSEVNKRLDALTKKPKRARPKPRVRVLDPVQHEMRRQISISRWSRLGRTH